MPVEIERKFLPASDEWREKAFKAIRLRDGLIATEGGRKVRVRIADDQATITVKGARQGQIRDEFEYPIPLLDAEAMLECHCEERVLTKTRHLIREQDFVFEVDVYKGLLDGIVLIEAELTSPDQIIPRPSWLGEEITGRAEYKKINMLRDRSAALIKDAQ